MFDIKPIDNSGNIDVSKISNVQSVLNLGRRFKMGKTGVLSIKHKKQSIKYGSDGAHRGSEKCGVIVTPQEELEKYLNEELDFQIELAAIGAKVHRPSIKPSIKYKVLSIKEEVKPIPY